MAEPEKNRLQIEIDEATAQGIYSNLAFIAHSEQEFVLDFMFLSPQQPRAKVRARIITSPKHAKRFLNALAENIQRHEQRFGEIAVGEPPSADTSTDARGLRAMKDPRIEVVCVGSELLTGKVNTHAAYYGVQLADLGLKVAREHTVPDDERLMLETFREVFRRSDVVISAGGLGPTFDDITREVWSTVTRRPLRQNASLAAGIRRKFAKRKLEMPPANLRQSAVLRGAVAIANANGTAPGQFLRVGKKVLILLPGPTREMSPMFERFVLPRLQKLYRNFYARLKTFLIVGVPESRVDHLIRPIVEGTAAIGRCRVIHAILASQSVITVKFRVEGADRRAVDAAARSLAARFRSVLGPMVAGEDEDSFENLVGDRLARRRETIALAESCTGGLIAKMLTDRSGSSDYFVESVVTYANRSKERRLGVRRSTLAKRGAVSDEVAREMAEGARRTAGTTYGLSVTGIAGPTGGTKDKPVGLVYIACAGPRGTTSKKFTFSGDRAWIRHRAAVMALDLLRKILVSSRA